MAVLYCNLADQFVVNTFVMSMNDGVRSILSDLLVPSPPGSVGSRSLRARWQWPQTVAVADHAHRWHGIRERQTAVRNGEDDATGVWMVRPLHGAPGGDSRVDKVGKMMGDCSVRLQLKILHKVLRAATLHSDGWIRHFRWFTLGLWNGSELRKTMEERLKVKSYQRRAVSHESIHTACFWNNLVFCSILLK